MLHAQGVNKKSMKKKQKIEKAMATFKVSLSFVIWYNDKNIDRFLNVTIWNLSNDDGNGNEKVT